jgi:hypothetical protein
MNKTTVKQDILIYGGLFLLAFGVVFLSCLSPFSLKGIDRDTSVFLSIARGITKGQVPFRDFFDNKGPLMYLISAPGMAFGGFTGVWLTELFFMCVAVFFAYKTALLIENNGGGGGNKYIAFLGTLCSFIIFQSFFYEVAGAEEYSLPFMIISLYIFTKYYFTKKEPPVYCLLILGICFAVSVFIRINHFALWFGFCFVILIELVVRKQWGLLLKYILCFAAGILVVSVPVLLYLRRNNALQDYINQNLLSGGSRAFTGFSIKEFIKSFLTIMYKNFCFIPLVAGFLWIFKKPKNIPLAYAFGFLFSYLLTVFLLAVIRTNFTHYNMLLTPFLVPTFAFCIKLMFIYFMDVKHKNIIVLFFLVIVLSGEILKWLDDGYETVVPKDNDLYEFTVTGKTIDQWTKPGDTIISLGLSCQIYLFTERHPASRYFYQTSGAAYVPNMQEEFLSDLQKNKPEIIAIKNQDGRYDYLPPWYAPVYDMIANDYRLLSDENGYYLFIRK